MMYFTGPISIKPWLELRLKPKNIELELASPGTFLCFPDHKCNQKYELDYEISRTLELRLESGERS